MAKTKKRHFSYLKNKWHKKHIRLQKKLLKKHGGSLEWLENTSKQFMVGSVAGALMLTAPVSSSVIAQVLQPPLDQNIEKPAKTQTQLISQLFGQLPAIVQPLSSDAESGIAQTLSDYFNISVTAELEGKRLNRSYGLIGAEQHLMRYPGDTMSTHFASAQEASFASSGMAPGRGAWGYFVSSQQEMTNEDVAREKYYIAVPTFLSPGWNENVHEYYTFFKYRKMLVVNPENGKAIVAVIGDAGPAAWTGKHLGGSPEVMEYLERKDGSAKGPVLYFFISDPENNVKLGPREIAL